jgi:hypothetical protein
MSAFSLSTLSDT